MTAASWTEEDLAAFGGTEEIRLASVRSDGTFRSSVVIWVVRAGDDLYVRSAGGPDRPWYRAASASGRGRIQGGGLERAVTFADARPEDHRLVDAAYHAKYDRYGPRIVGSVVGPAAHRVTLRLIPATRS